MLELVCKVYNINKGKNKELLEHCKWLSDYMVFVDKVREYHNDREDDKLEEDISKAIDYCISNGYLEEFFTSRRSEVLEVTKVDYTFERRMKLNYDEGKDDGIKLGEKQMLLDKIAKKISKGKSISQIADELEESEEDIMELAKKIES